MGRWQAPRGDSSASTFTAKTSEFPARSILKTPGGGLQSGAENEEALAGLIFPGTTFCGPYRPAIGFDSSTFQSTALVAESRAPAVCALSNLATSRAALGLPSVS
jgi:hypothetical protein